MGVTGVEAIALVDSLEIKSRAYFSVHHIQAAAHFARQTRAIETARAGSSEFSPEHRGYAMAAVFFAVSFLEAGINELFTDASEGELSRLAGLPNDTIALMAEMWRRDVPRTARYRVLEKYAIALSLARRPAMNEGQAPWQSAQALIDLRNALVHYEPEWISGNAAHEPSEAHRLEKKLKTFRFEQNPLTGAGNPFYPDKVLGHGAAAWAVESATSFADEFATVLGIRAFHRYAFESLATV